MYSLHVYDENEIELPPQEVPPTPLARRLVLRGLVGGSVLGLAAVTLLSSASGANRQSATYQARPEPHRASAGALDRAEWRRFRERFIAPDGRVVDTGNGSVSHSEGQSYGLLLAEWANDRESFERIWGWTRENLARPGDALHAWRWQPGMGTKVEDLNAATDGDLMIAWALLRAGDRWNVAAWRHQAQAVAADILRLSTREVGGRLFLAPAPSGFDRNGTFVVNPSHYIFPAIRALAGATDDRRWAQIDSDGLWLLEHARFGAHGLTPDWVEVSRSDTQLRVASGWPPLFSWDAVRVPMYLSWAGEVDHPAAQAAVRFWNIQQQGLPIAWVDLRSGKPAPYQGHSGIQAVAQLATAVVTHDARGPELPGQTAASDYYAAALSMLARVAWQEGDALREPARQVSS